MNSYSIDAEKWSNLTIFEQMGNIYSEVGRSLSAKSRGDEEAANNALARCLDLFNVTVNNLIAEDSIRAKEVLRAREQYLELFYSEDFSKEDRESLDRYFLNFAKAARLHRL